MGEKRFVIGNWKSYKRFEEAKIWLDGFAGLYTPHDDVRVIIAPNFLCLEKTGEYLRSLDLKNVSLAAQDVSPFPKGPYTGAIAADLLKGTAEYVIVGHSERRRYFHETSQDVGNKVSETIDAGLTPIVCVDQPYAMSQLTSLNDIETDSVIIAYGPVESLNFRIPQTPEKIKEAAEFISQVHPKWPIVYGGALNPDIVDEYANIKGIAGLFVGSASLEAQSFHTILKAVCHTMNK
ncbi:triose-phosphate isomerase [Desulfopila inferna]|uniref:triose-phosphate isomerase n=1 Tax=Desulfopila inferna TaxID=468528 RepID=UPI00196304E8|nr:triose-phosphate isomerase family protein [Desulfopila inferna]MBM9605063.1 triosephosphate isomerase [Desulfopila inferna]